MEVVRFFGLLIVLMCGGVVGASLYVGRVPARWPMPAFDRTGAPVGFWLTILVYAVGAVLGAVIAAKFVV